MKPVWLLEYDVFHENQDALQEEIKHQGYECSVISKDDAWTNLLDIKNPKYWYDVIPSSNCVVYYGCLEFGQFIKNKLNYAPGAWCTMDNYDCSKYYTPYWNELLNQNHRFLPFGLLSTLKDKLYKEFGRDDTIFVRPNRGNKVFTGQLIYKEKFDEQLNKMAFYEPSQEELVVVAEPISIDREYRIIVIDGKAVTGSQYRGICNLFQEQDESHIPQEVFVFAEVVAQLYQPDKAFVVDIAETYGGYKVIEINSFSCSGWYRSNLSKIVKAASEAAEKEWADIDG